MSTEPSGVEEFVRRSLDTPDDTRPLRRRANKVGRDGLTCPRCRRSSAGIDYAPHGYGGGDYIVKFHCRFCGSDTKLDDAARLVGMTPVEVRSGNELLLARYAPNRRLHLPSEARLAEWVENLHARPSLVRWWTDERLVSRSVLREHEIGHDGSRFTLPVYNWQGPFRVLVNVRRYDPHPWAGEPKMLSAPGSGAHLYFEVPDGPDLVLTEGEPDCLAARSLGLPALTNTAGAATWRAEWSQRLSGRRIFIVYDRDAAGVAGSEKVAGALRQVGCEVFNVRLPMPFRPSHGPDLTDFLRGGGDLRTLLNDAYRRRRAERAVGNGGNRNSSGKVVTSVSAEKVGPS